MNKHLSLDEMVCNMIINVHPRGTTGFLVFDFIRYDFPYYCIVSLFLCLRYFKITLEPITLTSPYL